MRKIKKESPNISEELAEIIANYNAGASLTRSLGVNSPPIDKDSFNSLVNIQDPALFDETIILDNEVEEIIKRFFKEREMAPKLLSNGIKPPNSLLLYGPPGVGKTMLAKYVSANLTLPLITLDLSSAISSYLGKTGQNLKKVLDYGKESPSVLLLDEFDAVAKRRDDPTDLGELKRIVNVLLKELEEWPNHSIIIAATNHPEFLDSAIWRRFDLKIEMPFPSEEQRYKLWNMRFNNEIVAIQESVLRGVAKSVEKVTPSDIKQISDKVLRQIIIDEIEPVSALINNLKDFVSGDHKGNFNKQMALALKQINNKISQAKIADILGISTSTVNHHLKSKNSEK
ncbi:AAA family ATPase [Ureibacillus sp. Re31]|uniref:AAA family ATPase n=2 Tax=Ureibacillus galli TaxID=2762222 RepID=A0ABR8XAW3_9BACL|nr:AAA family ATPase [Ureibacillus galli]